MKHEIKILPKYFRLVATPHGGSPAWWRVSKEMPQKPTYEGDGYAPDGTFAYDTWICPNCGAEYEVEYDDYDYCPNCGQRIDWSDEE